MQDWPEGKTLNHLLTDAVLAQLRPRLNFLWVSDMKMPGTIPEGLWRCTKLEKLVMQHTLVEGALPVEIGNLTKLGQLFMWDMKMAGEPPIAGLKKCTHMTKCFLNEPYMFGIYCDEYVWKTNNRIPKGQEWADELNKAHAPILVLQNTQK